MTEVVLPRRAVPQPSPRLYPGGDCGACVLGGLLGISPREVYDRYRKGAAESISWWDMRQALWDARVAGALDRVVDEVPIWPQRPHFWAFGLSGASMAAGWVQYVRMGFDAGYYAIAGVAFDRDGPLGDGPDHWVLLCGHRVVRTPLDGGGASLREDVLVSCSASGPAGEWIKANTFLRERGGFNVFLARPASGGN